MTQRVAQIGLVGVLTAVFGTWAIAGDEKPAESKCPALIAKCPVSDEPVDMKVSTADGHGGKVYFCCEKCMAKYVAEPSKYHEKAYAQQVALSPKRVQVACPTCAKPIDKKVSADHHGMKMYFCCAECAATFQKDEAKYESKLASCFTLQTKCPLTGRDIEPAMSGKTKDGHSIYFCCGRCVKAFESDPEKVLKKMGEGAKSGIEDAIKGMK